MLKNTFLLQDEKYNYMYAIPPKIGRYIVLDTETTGLNHRFDHIIELAAHEISNGKLTGSQFHIFIKPRMVMTQHVINIHKMDNSFYEDYYKNTYESERNLFENFVKFVGSSQIFAHNAPFDMGFINSELKHFNLTPLNPEKFRCTMRIFNNVTSVINPEYYVKCNLSKCCEYFNLKRNDDCFHTAIYDSLMTAKMLCKMLEIVDSDKKLKENKKINYMSNTIEQFLDKENNEMSNLISHFDKVKSKLNKSFKKRKKVQLKINESFSYMNELIYSVHKKRADYNKQLQSNKDSITNRSILNDHLSSTKINQDNRINNYNTKNDNKSNKKNNNNSPLELSFDNALLHLTEGGTPFAIQNNI